MRLDTIVQHPIRLIEMRPFVRVTADQTVSAVIDQMRAIKRGSAIVEDHGKPIGMFTERDALTRLDRASPDWPSKAIGEVMTAEPRTISQDESVALALRRMHRGHYRHLPVVDGDGQIVGVLSIRDLIGYIASRFPAEFINLPPDPDHEASAEWGG